jgi:hypothetical protein
LTAQGRCPHGVVDVAVDHRWRGCTHGVGSTLRVGEPRLHTSIHRVGFGVFVFVGGGAAGQTEDGTEQQSRADLFQESFRGF